MEKAKLRMEETNDTAQSDTAAKCSPALCVAFYSCMQVICYPRPKINRFMVSVHSLHATFQRNKGAMLPPALTREGPDGAGRMGCASWLNPTLGWGSGWGTGCGAPGCCVSGEKEHFWHVGLAPPPRRAPGGGQRQRAGSAPQCFRDKAILLKKELGALQSIEGCRGCAGSVCVLAAIPGAEEEEEAGGKWQQAPCSTTAARHPPASSGRPQATPGMWDSPQQGWEKKRRGESWGFVAGPAEERHATARNLVLCLAPLPPLAACRHCTFCGV